MLGLSLLPGIAALWPGTPPEDREFISTDFFKTIGERGQESRGGLPSELDYESLELLESFPDSGEARDVVASRRRLIQFQLGLLAAASLLLAVAFCSAI